MYRLLFLTIALIVYGSLYPWRFDFSGSAGHPLLVLLHSWPTVWDRFALRDAAVNLLLYLPLGAAAIWAPPRRLRGALGIAPVVLGAAALSISMEILQVYVPGRVCSLSDVLCNTVGAASGVALALVYHPAPAGRGQAKVPANGLLLLALFAGYEMYPFFPVLSQTALRHSLESLVAAEGFSLSEVWCWAGEWFAALVILKVSLDARTGTPAGRTRPLLALLCLPLRMVIPARTLALHEVLGAAAASLAWILLPGHVRLRTAAWFLAAAIVLHELAPFHFAAAPSTFSWIPFAPTLASDWQSALVVLFSKAFDYGAMVWLLAANGISYARAGTAVAAALAVLEAVQRYLPGRTPETTDAVLTIILTAVLWSLNNFQHRRGLA